MFRRVVSLILLLVLLPHFTACTVHKTTQVPPREVDYPIQEEINGITTLEGQEIEFDRPHAGMQRATIKNDTIFAAVDGRPFRMPLDHVSHLWLQRKDTAGSIVASFFVTIGIIAVVGLVAAVIVALTKDSCPFVYSWDGEQYVFNAEPYGGAVTRGLERDDYGELEYLEADEGVYKLRITNEVRETQYTNLLELWVVDHAPGTRVAPDEWGNIYTVADYQTLAAATDGNGNDLRPWLIEKDLTIWEPEPIPGPDGELREEIVLTFPKPEGATQAWLLANVATGLWGSYMISEMLELRGDQVDEWYRHMDTTPAAVDSLYMWNIREGTYILGLEVATRDGWTVRGLLPGGGPFIAEDRVVPLDLAGVTGEHLKIRIRPPKGYWALNWFAVDYGPGQDVAVDTLHPLRAIDHNGRDVLATIQEADDRYYEMPNTGDYGFIEFAAPGERPGLYRTVILHSRGFYKLHLAPAAKPDVATLRRLTWEPGYAATFAADRYADYRAQRILEP